MFAEGGKPEPHIADKSWQRTLVSGAQSSYQAAMMETFTLAHLSDVHLGPLPRLGARHWNVKRSLGFLNWHKNRRHVHLRETLDALTADVTAQRIDHVAVTGDLANIGLPEEYSAVERWLASLGGPAQVSVVPGNHDIYTRLRGDPGVAWWRAYMTSGGAAGSDASVGQKAHGQGDRELLFPFVRRFGRVVIIGANSAVETRPFYAGGRLGAEQRERLGVVLQKLGGEGVIRVVLIHHPPLPGQAKRSKALEDAAELESLLRLHGAELVLHGHNHLSMFAERPTAAGGNISVFGVPSASLGRHHKDEHLARYHLFRIGVGDNGRGIEMISRGLATPDGPVVEIERRLLVVRAHA